MKQPGWTLLAMCLATVLCGCASHPTVEAEQTRQVDQRQQSVDQRMLQPTASAANASAAVQPYTLAASERFRMPRALRSAGPELPPTSPRQTLAPTTICARVILTAEGVVQRVDPLVDRDECTAGSAVENADLFDAVRAAVQQWQFEPAAMCRFAPGHPPPAELDDCSGASNVQPVPVTLSFAFTFQIQHGKTRVRTGAMTH
ncbi:hypothetical protein [Xanthomonas maliensis]|uniref:hypothetical protein n=1 Tax=Xanthomonas maliensis TaxID=1321368 RepID=UPI0003A74E56|nr:hypothetical protein [Xanthomonas maliensis]KAB7767506.1 hypothetical protein CKY51_11470 [Xanthomonas maliensis]